jgi:hypothetical protein
MPASKTGHFLKSYFDDTRIDNDLIKEFGVTYDYLLMNDFEKY